MLAYTSFSLVVVYTLLLAPLTYNFCTYMIKQQRLLTAKHNALFYLLAYGLVIFRGSCFLQLGIADLNHDVQIGDYYKVADNLGLFCNLSILFMLAVD